MGRNNFRPQKFYDCEIVDESNLLVGKIRVKPSGILWSPKGTHGWWGVSLQEFTGYMKEKGKKKKK